MDILTVSDAAAAFALTPFCIPGTGSVFQVACPPAVVAHDDTCGPDSLDIAAFDE